MIIVTIFLKRWFRLSPLIVSRNCSESSTRLSRRLVPATLPSSYSRSIDLRKRNASKSLCYYPRFLHRRSVNESGVCRYRWTSPSSTMALRRMRNSEISCSPINARCSILPPPRWCWSIICIWEHDTTPLKSVA